MRQIAKVFSSTSIWVVVGFSLIATSALAITINGAGATFPYPLYTKWFSEFQKVDPEAQVNYQSIGSGGGIQQLIKQTVDFGASDAPMKDEEIKLAQREILHIPSVIGSVVLSFNLPQGPQEIHLSGEVIADMYMGKITKWNDERIQKLNPGLNFPDTYVLPVYRSDGSGTTSIFTDYLSKVSPDWKKNVGQGKSVKWTKGIGIGGKGNEGVTGLIKQTPGSIGYIEMAFAETNKMAIAAIQNKAGKFVRPTTESITAAAAGTSIPADFRVSITNAPGEKSYPIAGFTYLLIPKVLPKDKGAKIVAFLKWAMGPGQDMAAPLSYAPLPKNLVEKVQKKVKEIRIQ